MSRQAAGYQINVSTTNSTNGAAFFCSATVCFQNQTVSLAHSCLMLAPLPAGSITSTLEAAGLRSTAVTSLSMALYQEPQMHWG
jgi:hypothetical protein